MRFCPAHLGLPRTPPYVASFQLVRQFGRFSLLLAHTESRRPAKLNKVSVRIPQHASIKCKTAISSMHGVHKPGRDEQDKTTSLWHAIAAIAAHLIQVKDSGPTHYPYESKALAEAARRYSRHRPRLSMRYHYWYRPRTVWCTDSG